MIVLQIVQAFPGLVLAFALRALLLGILCALALRVLQVRSSTLKYAAWRLILFAMLAFPLLPSVAPVIRLPLFSAIQSPLRSRQIVLSPARPQLIPQIPGTEPQTPFPAQLTRSSDPATALARIGLALYLLVTVILLGRIFLGRQLMRRAVQRMERLDDSYLLGRANLQCESLRLLIFPEFRTGETVSVPVTFGWRRPTILLPAGWREWAVDKLDFVLAHELSHIQRGDYLIRVASAFNKALYWFHPLAWWLDRRLTELGEHLSDDAALTAVSPDRERYAGIVTDFASALGHSSRRFQLGIAMAGAASGDRRIKRILDQQRVLSSALNLRQKLVVFGLGIPSLVLVGGAQTADRSRTSLQNGPSQQNAQIPAAGSPRPRRVPPPMFSRAYSEALQGILGLEPSDVVALEQQLSRNPDDFAARLKLIAYFMRADRLTVPDSRSRRVNLLLWLLEHRPDSEILGSPYAILSPADLTPDQLIQAQRWWETVTGPGQTDARVFWNAANFHQQLDRRSYIAFLERAVALAPGDQHYALSLGLLYAGAILTVNPQSMYRDSSGPDPGFARHAAEALDSTRNPYIVEPAVKLLQNEYNRSLMMGRQNAPVGALAERYFERAKALDPDLDEAWIHPPIDPKMIGMLAPGTKPPDSDRLDFESAAKQIRRVSPEAFPKLPPDIRTELRNRGCLIPEQTAINEEAPVQRQNVIEGEFFEKGKTSFAVLCSVNESSSILVFRDASDRHPDELAKSEDKNQLQGIGNGEIAYSRLIQAVDSKFILDHYRAYGGPEPPPLDHQGIDDAFLEKASVTYYCYRGEWRKLTGSD
jgi:beta-lactamase regulating signal transducer with metallopeptidase domain